MYVHFWLTVYYLMYHIYAVLCKCIAVLISYLDL